LPHAFSAFQILRLLYNGGVSISGRFSCVAALLILSTCRTTLAAAPEASPPWETRFLEAPPGEVLEASRKVTVADDPGVVLLLEERVVTFEKDGKSTTRYRSAFKILKESSVRDWDETNASWDEWLGPKPTIRARVITKDGRAHSLDPKTIEISGGDGRDDEVYSDSRSLRAPLPAVAAGAVVEEEVVVEEGPLLAGAGLNGRWFMGSAVPLMKSRLVLDAPADLKVTVAQKLPTPISPVRTEHDGRVRLVYEAGPLGSLTDPEPDGPTDVPAAPYIGYATGTSWKDVGARYAAVVDAQIAGSDLRAIVREARDAGPRDPDALIGRLLARLHREVRYTGVEFGEASIVPRRPQEVLERHYGDCKDKASFLVALLREAGLRANVALLHSGGSDVDADLPGPTRFNHAIVYLPGPKSGGRWIDPTDRFAAPGELPLSDQDRFALIADTKASALVRTPRAPASANRVVERRELTLQEDGGALVFERTEATGEPGRQMRSYYDRTERKKLEEELTRYVKNEYAVEKLKRSQWSDARDVSGPFWLEVESPDSKISYAEQDVTRVYLRTARLFDRLPDSLRPGAKDVKRGDRAEPPKKRVSDFVFEEGYVYELHYKVVPPHGFAAAPPPGDETINVGPCTMTSAFRVDKSGAILADLKFETGKLRLSPAEITELRAALAKLYEADYPLIAFRQVGEAALAAGHVREALAEFRRLDAAHPGQALHGTQVALALLRAGLGDEARRQAQRAVDIAPKSSFARRIQGWILEHDLLGRWRHPGADLPGAEAAYRKALELDPKDQVARASLAIVLEHDATGRHSYPRARLEEASRLYAEVRKSDDKRYDQNALVVLLHRERFDDVVAQAREMSVGRDGQAVVLAAIAAKRGVPEMLKDAATRVANPDDRRWAIRVAAAHLIQLRRYPEASALFVEVGRSGAEADVHALADQLSHTRRRETVKLDPRAPDVVFKNALVALVLESSPDPARLSAALSPYFAPELVAGLSAPEARAALARARETLVAKTGNLPGEVLADLIVGAEIMVEGDATAGYRVRWTAQGGSGPMSAYLGMRPGGPRVVGFAPAGGPAGAEALRFLAAGDLTSARRWLDWSVEGQALGTADDPLGGSTLARLWTRGSATTDRARIARAAAALLATDPVLAASSALPALEPCRASTTAGLGETERSACLVALVDAYHTLKRWNDLLAVGTILLELYPTSPRAVISRSIALSELGRFKEQQAMLQEALRRRPDLQVAEWSLEASLAHSGDLAAAEVIARRAAEAPTRTEGDFNQLAWIALCRGNVGDATLAAARRAVELGSRRHGSSLHTLAAVLAERDAPEEAFQILLELFEMRGEATPTSADWYVLGRIAEGYGVPEAAAAAYARVEKPRMADLMSTWTLADRRASKLKVVAAPPAAASPGVVPAALRPSKP
jgi:tetratricopeptide (TPR) repeat protein